MIKLAVIGASYLQLPLIQKANEMGIETHCFAWHEGAVCSAHADFFYPISILEKDLILNECRKIGIHGIVTIATDIAVPTISYVAESLGLIANSYESALMSTDKLLMRKMFSKNDCSTPKFTEAKGDEFNVDNFLFPLIIKPTDRSGSRGVSRVNSKESIGAAITIARQQSLSDSVIIEEYIDGVEVSVESISWKGNHTIIAITDKVTTGPPHFVELAHHQPSKLSKVIQDRIKIETLKCLNALNIKYGASHSEFKITTSGKVFVVEVGARMGGDFIGSTIVKLSTGYDYLRAVINISLGKYEEIEPFITGHAGVYFLSKETEKLLPYFSNHNKFEYQKQILSNELKYLKDSNDRSGYLIYNADKKIDIL